MRFAIVGRKLVPEAEAVLSASDRGLLFGDGLFETVRAYGGRLPLWEEHWARLRRSAGFLGIPLPAADPHALALRLLEANELSEGSVRVTLTRGAPREDVPAPRPEPPERALLPTLLLHARPLRPDLEELRAGGISGRRAPWPLRARGLPLQGHKTLAYLGSVLALARAAAGEEPILETTEGHLAETATGNLFWRQGGEIRTPSLDSGCLPGVARSIVLRAAGALGIPVREGLFPVDDLRQSEEALLTNAVQEVIPLVRFEGAPVGQGSPGPVTVLLQNAYRREVASRLGEPA
ncbi:MAG: aminotransferase class IV family protein [Deltaproteobacteria bacterium]|nr:aminotransferase class IV family protein [Deltaproteobacteria bacterium]